MKTEEVGLGMWASTPQSVPRPRPATIHETGFSYCMPEEEFTSLPAWDSSTMPLQQPMHDGLPQTYTMQRDFYPSTSNGEGKFNAIRDEGVFLEIFSNSN